KGAPEVILPRTSHHLTTQGQKILTNQTPIHQAVDQMANKALRTIAISMKPLKKDESLDSKMIETDLTFIGLYGMMDQLLKEVKTAIKDCKEAHIKTVMITGDHKKTASAIARQLDLIPSGGLVLEGKELNQMTKGELETIIEDVYVFARVTPEHKLNIVEAFQAKGH